MPSPNRRVIETWFDPKYKEYFYTREPLARFVDMGDISEQLDLKKKLECKSFDWFMREIAYDVFDKYPPLPPNKIWGELKNLANNFCMDTQGRHPPEKVSWFHMPSQARIFESCHSSVHRLAATASAATRCSV